MEKKFYDTEGNSIGTYRLRNQTVQMRKGVFLVRTRKYYLQNESGDYAECAAGFVPVNYDTVFD